MIKNLQYKEIKLLSLRNRSIKKIDSITWTQQITNLNTKKEREREEKNVLPLKKMLMKH